MPRPLLSTWDKSANKDPCPNGAFIQIEGERSQEIKIINTLYMMPGRDKSDRRKVKAGKGGLQFSTG